MVQKPRAIKYKVVAGYLLLFAIAVISVWFVYTEILKIAKPSRNDKDNQQIIKISNVIADLYASEALGRSAIVTGSGKDYNDYIKLTDSINRQVDALKNEVDDNQKPTFDSLQRLLNRKKYSTAEIYKSRSIFAKNNTLQRAITNIYIVKDSIKDAAQPVRSTKKYHWDQLVSEVLSEQQRDSLSKLPVSNDSLAMAFDKVIANEIAKDKKVRDRISKKEEKLLEENRVISDKLRTLLSAVEKEFLKNSYAKIRESQTKVSETTKTMAWIGAVTFFLLIIFAVIIVRDLTSQQNYRRRLEILNKENEGLLRSKSMLMATVTHDLQTPLGSIIGFHDLLKESGITGRQKQYLSNIRESAGYILKLVNDLLDFSRLENNKITIEKIPFNIRQLVENTCKSLEPIAHNKNIELTWDIDEELNTGLLSDPYRIKQVLTNLVSNAVKFTNEGSVEVTGRLQGDKVYISVIDTGIGIDKENHDNVFREFTQAHSGIEKKFGGTGLGLTISRRIIELLDGDIKLESEGGKGSIFTIELPFEQADTVAIEAEVQERDSTAYLQDKKILIVDDDNVQLKLMKELFSNYPVIASTEINSSSVLSLLESGNFDIVLTDIQMPVLDGFALIDQIRNHDNPAIAALPVVALSGRRDLTEADYIEKGFTAHHPKPIQLEVLLVLLSHIFGYEKKYTQKAVAASNVTAPLYNLDSLKGFTNNDRESLKAILQTFISSADDNCAELHEAATHGDAEKVAVIAHKMIPMLRQMEIYSIADLLAPLEDRRLIMDTEELVEYIEDVCSRMKTLINALKADIA